jgi:uncharacterized protein (DUF983 family)
MTEKIVPAPASRPVILWRGITKRCARCGGGKLFTKWFVMAEDCPHCGLHFEREQGYWTGAIAISLTVFGTIFAAVLIGFSALTVPDIPWVTLLMIEVPIMTIGPAAFYPYSKTIWVAVDRAFLMHL